MSSFTFLRRAVNRVRQVPNDFALIITKIAPTQQAPLGAMRTSVIGFHFNLPLEQTCMGHKTNLFTDTASSCNLSLAVFSWQQ